MVQIILIWARTLGQYLGHNEDKAESWQRDPLAHPVLDAMSLTELADLPPLRSCCRE